MYFRYINTFVIFMALVVVMIFSFNGLKDVLSYSVVELRFKRRRFKPGWNDYRRMLCTNGVDLLNSIPGKIALHFKKPSHPPKYNIQKKALIVAWDILWQDYRCLSPEKHEILAIMPVRTDQEIMKFWEYFNDILSKMSGSDKIKFMNS